MKRSMLFAAGICFVLGGCASSGGSRTAQRYGDEVDVGKVIAVNQWAQTKGATVVWVNLPQKTRAESSSTVN